MSDLARTLERIGPADAAVHDATARLLDAKTKPRGSLGRLEELACRVAAVRGRADLGPPGDKAIVVMGADHGVARHGVSAYPPEVTHQMMLNFAAGGAAINVLARHAGARLVVADLGITVPLPREVDVLRRRIGPGTQSFLEGPAMSRDDATAALEVGIALAAQLIDEGVELLAVGDMGIGNTTASSAVVCALTGAAPESVVGRGTGIDEIGLTRKRDAVRQGLEVNAPDPRDGLDVLAKLGGFEIAGLAGVILGAAAGRVPVVLDGFITGAAALVAHALAPDARDAMIASHRSVEPGHRAVFDRLELEPLLDLDLRLGEGTGAALALPIVEASIRILREMATFADAGVSDSGA